MTSSGEVVRLTAPAGLPYQFNVEIDSAGPHAAHRRVTVTGPTPGPGDKTLQRCVDSTEHESYSDFYFNLAQQFGIKVPVNRRGTVLPPPCRALRPLLIEAVSPLILYGYGDPSVLKVETETGPRYYLVVTSNDAPNAFPILRSDDLVVWELQGFVFPEGNTPAWSLTGENLGDFWAPELHRVGDEFWVCFSAREKDRDLAIGIAKSNSPEGPFETAESPILRGGVIDAHILLDKTGAPWLFWKEDNNGIWPGLIADLLLRRPDLIAPLYTTEEDQRTVSLIVTLWPWIRTLEPMEQFFAKQPLIEATTDNFQGFEKRLAAQATTADEEARTEIAAIIKGMRTRVYAQQVNSTGTALIGEPVFVIENDQSWEAHLIEGIWITEYAGKYYMLYSGNDFSTHQYGIGCAVSNSPLGPYTKMTKPLLRSTSEWIGPGHPSIAIGPDGQPMIFLHAFAPAHVGYKAFRALLCAPIKFADNGIEILCADRQ